MPVYNGEAFLADAIESVVNQDYGDWELIIIDNGSTDNSVQRISEYANPRVILLREDKLGASNARNKGLANMNGEFFCFLDCDDMLTPNSISSRVKLLSDEPGIAFADGCVSIRNADMSKELNRWTPGFYGPPLESLLRHSPKVFFGQTWMFRRKNGVSYRYNQTLTNSEDLYFCIEHALQGMYGFTRETILHYRIHPGQASSLLNRMENGYRISGEEMKKLPHVSEHARRKYIRKAWSITLKSYVKAGKPKDAIRVFLNPGFRP
jgi:glycosyltransferase involved in cell wall biosynthesis